MNSSAFIVDTIYRSPSDSAFFNHFELVLEKVWAKFKNVVIMGDLNCDFARKERNIVTSTFGRKLQILITQFNYTVANDQPTRITSNTSTLIDLVITSRPDLITKTKILELGISDHMLVQATLKTKIKRPPPKIVRARSYRRFNKSMFAKEIEETPWSVCSTFENPDDHYQAWLTLFNDICDKYAPYREIKIRRQSLPWITPQIRHLMNDRYKTLLKAKRTNNHELWIKYRKLRNTVTQEVRSAKCKYYAELFDEVKDCKSYWKLVKNAANTQSKPPIMGIRNMEGKIETSDQGKAELLNKQFSTVGEKLANEIPAFISVEPSSYISRITPTVMVTAMSNEIIAQGLKNLKVDKACGPDKVSPKLLKYAGDGLIPSLLSLCTSSTTSNLVPSTWKTANITPIFKKEDETDRHNYRPISLLCVPGKILESAVGSTMLSHITEHGLSNNRQWAYKKQHSTELLLVKMTEDWRRALDNHQVVGVVFVDFRKAFDSISHEVLLHKLQGLGISGDLWLWIKDYLSDHLQITTVNGQKSRPMSVKYGVLRDQCWDLFCSQFIVTICRIYVMKKGKTKKFICMQTIPQSM